MKLNNEMPIPAKIPTSDPYHQQWQTTKPEPVSFSTKAWSQPSAAWIISQWMLLPLKLCCCHQSLHCGEQCPSPLWKIFVSRIVLCSMQLVIVLLHRASLLRSREDGERCGMVLTCLLYSQMGSYTFHPFSGKTSLYSNAKSGWKKKTCP